MKLWKYAGAFMAIGAVVPWVGAAELAKLTNQNWDKFAVDGKELDGIIGDFALKNDLVVAVVAQPGKYRHANLFIRNVGGCLLDFTTINDSNDQLGTLFPGNQRFTFTKAKMIQSKGRKVVLRVSSPGKTGKDAEPDHSVDYILEDGKPYLTIRSVFTNPTNKKLRLLLDDGVRMDYVEDRSARGKNDIFWIHDRFFDQAYAVVSDHSISSRSTIFTSSVRFGDPKTNEWESELAPNGTHTLVRHVFPGRNLIEVKGTIAEFRKQPTVEQGFRFIDQQYRPVVRGKVYLKQNGKTYGTALTDSQGWVKARLPLKKFELTCKAFGRPTLNHVVDLSKAQADQTINTQFSMDNASAVAATVTDERGLPIPCKVQFNGLGDTKKPNWGPPAARRAVVNLYYSENGKFEVAIDPGEYEAIVSYGPEYDVVRKTVQVAKGKVTTLRAKLRRAFTSPGWVSADFHSHSSPSGDNTADQRGRVINLLAEHIEFAPCTEHNRIDTYVPHLKDLKAEHLMGTCSGIELTGQPLPLNHQNAFPMKLISRTQDGGAPRTDASPEVQIRRLATWGDPKAERLVQQNHPDIGWLFFDKSGDGKLDGGHKNGFAYMDVIEVHPIHQILDMEPFQVSHFRGKRNVTIFNWLQILNQGYRIPGVVNTDAHYNYHGSGGLRNYVRCDADVPGNIDPLDIVRHSKKGHLVMSTAPFMDVKLGKAIPGDDVHLKGGKGILDVKVFCANWYDIDRVQVLLNGHIAPKLNFTRKTHPTLFTDEALRFAHQIPISVPKDTHVIVVAVGEKSTLGDIMGPVWGRQNPVAVSNPIYVDVDGKGFQADKKDTIGHPLPGKSGAGSVLGGLTP